MPKHDEVPAHLRDKLSEPLVTEAPVIVPAPRAPAVLSPAAGLDHTQLGEAVAAGVAAALKAMGMTPPEAGTAPTNQAEKVRAEAKAAGAARPVSYVPFISREPYGTGATMLLVVSHRGRVVNMMNYQEPEGFDKIKPPGVMPGRRGRLPEGQGMLIEDRNGGVRPNLATQNLIYKTYFVRDNQTIIGRKLNEGGRMTDEEVAAHVAIYPDFLTPSANRMGIGAVYDETESMLDDEEAAE